MSEPDPQGAGTVEITPGQPVTVTDDLDDPVEVVVTNTYPVGSGEVVKVADGPLAPEYAPAGSQFLVAVTCSYPADFPVSGQIPGFNPAILPIEAGDPGQPGTPTPFGAVPVGSECTVVEVDDGGATEVEVAPPQPITIDSAEVPVTVTVTNTFEPAGVRILKVVEGPGGDPVPPDLVYIARLTCVFDGPNGVETVYDDAVEFGVGDTTVIPGPGAVTGLPVGAVCELTEIETHGASATIDPAGPFVLEGPDPVSVEVTVTNSFAPGELTVEKIVDGVGAALVPDGTTYSVSVWCELSGSRLEGFPVELTLTTPDQLSTTLTGLPVGSQCYATEADTNGATSPPTFDPPGTEDFQSGVVTIVEQPQDPIAISVTNTYPGAGGEIVKVVDGPQSGRAPEGTEFPVEVSCRLPADHPSAPGPVPGFDPLALTIEAGPAGQPGPSVSFGPVPVGSTCEVVETDAGGASSVVITPGQPVTIGDEQTPVEITVTNTYDEGGLTVSKVVDGPAAGLVPGDTVYTVRVTCTFDGQTVYDQELPFGVGAPASVPGLPIGAECSISETDSQGAWTVVIDPADAITIVSGDTGVAVTVTNTYPAGGAEFVKIVDGQLAGLAPEGTEFEVTVECSYPDGFPDSGPIPGYDPALVTVEAGPPGVAGTPASIGPLPVGAKCSVGESDSNGASMVEISPDSFVVEQPDQTVEVTVTNTYDPAALRVLKVVDGPGSPLIPADTVFTAQVTCTFENQTTF